MSVITMKEKYQEFEREQEGYGRIWREKMEEECYNYPIISKEKIFSTQRNSGLSDFTDEQTNIRCVNITVLNSSKKLKRK